MKQLLKYALPFVLGFALGFLILPQMRRKPSEAKIIRDTVSYTIFDTIVREKPVLRYSYIHDTVRTHFTTVEHDTVVVDVPIERKVYAEDSLYWAVVRGWNVSLDSLILYPKETIITIHEKEKIPPKRWSFGVTAGPSVLATPNGRVYGGLGATVGLSYRF